MREVYDKREDEMEADPDAGPGSIPEEAKVMSHG